MVPAFPLGTVLEMVESDEGATLTVTDLRCPPGFSDCLECNRRWAVWDDDGPHAKGWREVRAVGDADIDESPRLPPLGIYEPLVGASGEFLGGFESAFDPWPTPVTPHAEYLLVGARGVFGSIRHVWSEPLCGFIYDCWYGVREETGPARAEAGSRSARSTSLQARSRSCGRTTPTLWSSADGSSTAGPRRSPAARRRDPS